jgi:hypothetical protein
MNRRSFFTRLAKAAVIAAAAPIIIREAMARSVQPDERFNWDRINAEIRELYRARKDRGTIEIYVDADFAEKFKLAMAEYYKEGAVWDISEEYD